MPIEFSWNADKAASNRKLHGVTFEEAATAFGDPLSLTVHDPGHSEDETRYLLLGRAFSGKLLVVVHCERDDGIRLISAREATRRERQDYEQS